MTSSRIPIIDVSQFTSGSDAASLQLAAEVNQACEKVGFLVVTGHGVPARTIERMHALGRQFFDLPMQTKRHYQSNDPHIHTGYQGPAERSLANSLRPNESLPDLREGFSSNRIDLDTSVDYFRTPQARVLYPATRWPKEVPDFQAIWRDYYVGLETLARRLMRVFAVALGLPVSAFDAKIDKHFSSLVIYNYPEQRKRPTAGQLRGGAHTDFGSLTIVHADWTIPGGLQVYYENREWLDVPAVPGAFVVNIGDLMAQWTNNRWVSTLHRVANPPWNQAGRSRRQSIVFFCSPNYDVLVECLPTCRDADGSARYPPVTAGDHHLEKLRRMYRA